MADATMRCRNCGHPRGTHEDGSGQCADWMDNGAECPCQNFEGPFSMSGYTCATCGHAQSYHPRKKTSAGTVYTFCTHDSPGEYPCGCAEFRMRTVSETSNPYYVPHTYVGSHVGTTTYNTAPPVDKRSCTSCPHWVSTHNGQGCSSKFCGCPQTPTTIGLNRAIIDSTPLGRMCLDCRHPDLSHDGSGCQQFDSHAPCSCTGYRPPANPATQTQNRKETHPHG